MNFQPDGWSVVLIGRWNPAILSPAGISNYAFQLPAGTPISVAVPLDGISAYIVSNPKNTLAVNATFDKVQIDIKNCKFIDLAEGLLAGKNILAVLPITPISAIGFNLIYKSTQYETDVAVLIENEIERKFRLAGQAVVGKNTTLSLPFQGGQINISIVVAENETRLNCNFHLGTTDMQKAVEWLSLTEAVIRAELAKIATILNVSLGERI